MSDTVRRTSLVAAMVATFSLLTSMSVYGQALQLEDWQRAERDFLVDTVAGALSGDIEPQLDPFAVDTDFLKGPDGNTYAPFTLSFPPERVSSSTVALYVLVVPAEVATELTGDRPEVIFEGIYFAEATPSSDGQIRISRAISAPGGTYDAYIAMRDSAGDDDGDEPTTPILLMRHRLEVPDFWTPQLATSTMHLNEGATEYLNAPLTPQQQVASPYTFGTMRLVPKIGTNYSQQEILALLFLVYNPRLVDGTKPDVTVNYEFHRQTPEGEEFFNRTADQEFNDQTLGPDFDLTLGDQVIAGQEIPLRIFPPGDYRLEITVTDNVAESSLTHQVTFSVQLAG